MMLRIQKALIRALAQHFAHISSHPDLKMNYFIVNNFVNGGELLWLRGKKIWESSTKSNRAARRIESID
jgi:hypothetical protein